MYRLPGHVLFHGMSIAKVCSPAGAVNTHVFAAQIFTALILSLLLELCVRRHRHILSHWPFFGEKLPL